MSTPAAATRWSATAALAVALGACARCPECPPGPPGPPPDPVVDSPRVALANEPPLPDGCTRWSDGADALLSPDGLLLVFKRRRTITGRSVPREQREAYAGHGAEPLIPSVFVLDLATKSERPFPRWDPAGLGDPTPDWHGSPVTWTPGGALLFTDGAALDPRTGAEVPVLRPVLSEDPSWRRRGSVESRMLDDVRSWAWTSDGRRVSYVDRVDPEQPGESGRRAPFVREAGGTARRIDLTRPHDGKAPSWTSPGDYVFDGRFAWSPDGAALLLRLEFNHMTERGPRVVEGVALYSARDDGIVVLGEFTFPDRAMDARAGEPVWDVGGNRCVFLGGQASEPASPPVVYDRDGTEYRRLKNAAPAKPTTDVYVADRDGREVRRVTHDGVEKGAACMNPAGTRVAYFVGEGAGRRFGGANPAVRLRVVSLDRDAAFETSLAPPPDPWSPLGTLQWTPDGRRLVYTYGGIEGAVFAQDVPPAPR